MIKKSDSEAIKTNIILIVIAIIISIIFSCIWQGCSALFGKKSTSITYKVGDRVTLSEDTPTCSSKDNVDKMINYLQAKNEKGVQEMQDDGDAVILPKGTEINIIDVGTVTKIETSDGQDYYAPAEVIK